MAAAKPLQIKIEPQLYTRAEAFAQNEGFRSVASMAYYAFVQFLNQMEEKKFATWVPTEEEKQMLREGEEDIKAGRVYKLDPNNLHALFEDEA